MGGNQSVEGGADAAAVQPSQDEASTKRGQERAITDPQFYLNLMSFFGCTLDDIKKDVSHMPGVFKAALKAVCNSLHDPEHSQFASLRDLRGVIKRAMFFEFHARHFREATAQWVQQQEEGKTWEALNLAHIQQTAVAWANPVLHPVPVQVAQPARAGRNTRAGSSTVPVATALDAEQESAPMFAKPRCVSMLMADWPASSDEEEQEEGTSGGLAPAPSAPGGDAEKQKEDDELTEAAADEAADGLDELQEVEGAADSAPSAAQTTDMHVEPRGGYAPPHAYGIYSCLQARCSPLHTGLQAFAVHILWTAFVCSPVRNGLLVSAVHV